MRPTRPRRAARSLTALLLVAGGVHLVRPQAFDVALPDWLPGTKRAWALGSGVAELVCAGLVALPRTRRLGGRACAVLFVVVFPGNVHMARTARTGPGRALTLARLPLQVPLVLWALRVARQGGTSDAGRATVLRRSRGRRAPSSPPRRPR